MINSPGHPLWAFLRTAVLMLALTGVLFFTASKFDATEIRTIVIMFLVAAGAEGLPQIFKGKT